MPTDFENSKRPTQDELDMMRWEGERGRVGETNETIENPAFNQTVANIVASSFVQRGQITGISDRVDKNNKSTSYEPNN